MALRYSGDVEVRVRWDPSSKSYKGSVSDPYFRWKGTWTPTFSFRTRTEPAAYDKAAEALLGLAERAAKKKRHAFQGERRRDGGFVMSRVFKAPCPCATGNFGSFRKGKR
jgi:hypothetical protein